MKPNPHNPNTHPQEQIELLAEIYNKTGIRAAITVSRLSGYIVKGHGRLLAAQYAGFESFPIEYQEFADLEEETAALLADNKIAEFAQIDNKILAELVEELDFENFDIGATGYSKDEFDDILQSLDEAAGEENRVEGVKLSEVFIAPPFSVLLAKSSEWQQRKNYWLDLGIKSEVGRGVFYKGLGDLQRKSFNATEKQKANAFKAETSIFDPVLCEIAYSWFSKKDDKIIDPFAGGSVRGIIASALQRQYLGLELRDEQVEANIENAAELCADYMPEWKIGDSNVLLDTLEDNIYDMCLSCPPYADLEVYSDLEADLSNMDYPDFMSIYRSIIKKLYSKLKENSFVVWVVGEVRNDKGNYYNFIGDTIKAFIDAGFNYYNEIILETMCGAAALRAAKQFGRSRKVVKIHQNVLVFCKGDGRLAADGLGDVEVKDISIEFEDEDLNF
ncbi:MAG: ParB N-terminal domain-containing protein [Clostridia bacterium]|nr:ParB N-terminal domain-containing protein [Clostridia bacterium]